MRIRPRTTAQLHRAGGFLDRAAYGRLLQYCADNRLFRQGRQLHARLVLHSFTRDNSIAAKLITFYSKSNRIWEARFAFDAIPRRNICSWNALLISYTAVGRYRDAVELFARLVGDSWIRSCGTRLPHGVLCSEGSLSFVFQLEVGEESPWIRCVPGFNADTIVMNGLVTFYSRCSEVNSARKLFDRMPERDISSWNSMMAEYAQCSRYEECKELYREMLGSVRLRPNELTAVCVLQACGHSKDLLLGMEMHQYLVDNKIKIGIFLHNALMAFKQNVVI